MVKRYPYQLWVETQSESTLDSGAFMETETNWSMMSICRDEANNGGQTVQLVDSSNQQFTSLIQLPTSCPPIAEGTPIQVRDGSTVRVAGTVKRFSRDQLHCRLWV